MPLGLRQKWDFFKDQYRIIPLGFFKEVPTVDGRNHIHVGCIKPCKSWDKVPTDWCRISSINSGGIDLDQDRTQHHAVSSRLQGLLHCRGHDGPCDFCGLRPSSFADFSPPFSSSCSRADHG